MPPQQHSPPLVQLRLPNGQVILGPPPQMMETSPKNHSFPQNKPYFAAKQQQLRAEDAKMKLNPFEQIQE